MEIFGQIFAGRLVVVGDVLMNFLPCQFFGFGQVLFFWLLC